MMADIKYSVHSSEELNRLEKSMEIFFTNYDIESKDVKLLVNFRIGDSIEIFPRDVGISTINKSKKLIKEVKAPNGTLVNLAFDRGYLELGIDELFYKIHLNQGRINKNE